MQHFLAHFKLHTKLIFGFAILLGLLFLASSLIRDRLVDMRDEIAHALNGHRPVELLSTQLDVQLHDAFASLGLYVSSRKENYAGDYREKFARVMRIFEALQGNPLVHEDTKLSTELDAMNDNLTKMSELGEQLLHISANDETTYPGLAYANEHINPLNREILQTLSQLLNVEKTMNNDRQFLLRVANLRYYWINVVSGMRGYLAFRGHQTLADTELYLIESKKLLKELMRNPVVLPFEQEDAIEQIDQAIKQVVPHWRHLMLINNSERWRADSYLIRTQIAPLVNNIETQLNQFTREQKNVMDAVGLRILDHSNRITQLVETFLLAGILVSIVLSWGISRIVARPIREAAEAMQNIASGEPDLTQRLDAVGSDELAMLACSFNIFTAKAQQSAEQEAALSGLMRLSLESTELESYLDQALALMIDTVTWLSLLPKGGIFATTSSDKPELKLIATHNFSPELLDLCATVPFGHCLCGRAAETGEVVFSSCVDERHDIRFDRMQPHGHYNVPIKSSTTVLGVLVLYLPDGHQQTSGEDRFLHRVAEVLGLGIRLRQANVELRSAKHRAEVVNSRLTGITANIPGIIFQCHHSPDGKSQFLYVSRGTSNLLGTDQDDTQEDIKRLFSDIHPQDKEGIGSILHCKDDSLKPVNAEYRVFQPNGSTRWILCNAVPRRNADGSTLWDGLLLDITDRKSLETQLLQAQKLESVGQLAAGIAHEINTPTQYVQDNTRFLQDAFTDYHNALESLQQLRRQLPDSIPGPEQLDEVDNVLEAADIDYLSEEIPNAIKQSLEGLQRIASIVAAMKEFSHPGTDAKQPVDINGVINNIITVSRNEWKYVADLDTELDTTLPFPQGHRDKLGQVILNLIVNAAHAIGDQIAAGKFDKGHIRIRTATVDGEVEVRVSDNGPGIPEAIQQKIFDPFFTTKDVGKGTGQGLSISRSVVVDQHHGSLTLESTPGEGSTFIIRLPCHDKHSGDSTEA